MSLKLSFRCWDITIFFQFSRWLPLPSWIFEIVKFYWLLGCRGSSRIGMPNFVKIGQSVAKILTFVDFTRWRPSAILDLFEAYLDHQQWVFGGLYHSAKFGYDRWSSFYNNEHFNIWPLWLENAYSRPENWGFGAIWSHNRAAISTKAKKAHPCVSPRFWAIKRVNLSRSLACRSVSLKKGYK